MSVLNILFFVLSFVSFVAGVATAELVRRLESRRRERGRLN